MDFIIHNKKIKAEKSGRRGFRFKSHKTAIYFDDFKYGRDVVSMLFVFQKLNVYFFDEDKKPIKHKLMYPFISFAWIPKNCKYIVEIPN